MGGRLGDRANATAAKLMEDWAGSNRPFDYSGKANKGFHCEGIDTYAVLVAHEWEHWRQRMEWWGGGTTRHWNVCTPAQKRNPEHCDGTVPGYVCDCDADDLPDRLESGMGLDSHRLQTNPFNDLPCTDDEQTTCTDSHWVAYKVGESWPVGKANKEDWSYPGKQWPEGR